MRTKTIKTISSVRGLKRAGALFVLAILVTIGFSQPIIRADQYDQQIQALQQQNANAQSNLNGLQSEASSYQNAITMLQQQISAMQSAIAANQAKEAQVQQQISDDEAKIAQEKVVLGDDLKTMYVDGQMSTIEELATSNSLSDYVDKEEYRTAVQSKIQTTLQELATLQTQLQQQKQQLDVLLKTEQVQNDQLNQAEAQQQQLLAYNQSQQDAYNAQIQANQSQIANLRAQQAAANRRLLSGGGSISYSGACGGSYPSDASGPYGNWGCSYGKDSTLDNFGMYNRECVSYTAWMVYQTYGYSPTGFGNANMWPASARAVGIATGSTPKVGSVAIWNVGYYGHAMWVTGVDGNMITVQQYNYDLNGTYSTMTINASGLTYIYFGG
ncbi:MAG TPA: CHAP domain-containing protein [Candidatus Saccharimonadales bacterium]|nr:CHAP domain-containing protein [Candidatus Saccharimonadales bacterium]